jgi:hypothetical protein
MSDLNTISKYPNGGGYIWIHSNYLYLEAGAKILANGAPDGNNNNNGGGAGGSIFIGVQ